MLIPKILFLYFNQSPLNSDIVLTASSFQPAKVTSPDFKIIEENSTKPLGQPQRMTITHQSNSIT